ncbi:hypothetical protein TNCV_640071 [Trichonephila clavipes]|nr:hypothetical protein TNCV_640071 [Trichonephila clavipes]
MKILIENWVANIENLRSTALVNSIRTRNEEHTPKQSVLQAMTKRVLVQRRSGASASFGHGVLRKFSVVEVDVLLREAG